MVRLRVGMSSDSDREKGPPHFCSGLSPKKYEPPSLCTLVELDIQIIEKKGRGNFPHTGTPGGGAYKQ